MPLMRHAFYMKEDHIDSNVESARSEKNDFYKGTEEVKLTAKTK